jgi:hypothetical protein
VWLVDFLNGRYVYLSDVTEVDDRWLRGTNYRGRSILVRRDLVRAVGQATPVDQRTVARTVRQRLIAIPGRLVNHAGSPILRGPLNWPWRHWFSRRLTELRAVQPVPV